MEPVGFEPTFPELTGRYPLAVFIPAYATAPSCHVAQNVAFCFYLLVGN